MGRVKLRSLVVVGLMAARMEDLSEDVSKLTRNHVREPQAELRFAVFAT